jgi:DNA-directed RNA polymerase subunit K/omega
LDISEAGLFVKVNVAAQRARQIMQGAAPKVQTRSRKPAAIAVQEVFEGQVEAFHVSELPEMPEEDVLAGDVGEAGAEAAGEITFGDD